MKLRNIKTIISREYLTRVQKKSFLLITFLGPVFFAAIAVLPSIIMFMAEDKGKQIAVVDQSGIVMQKMESNSTITYHDYSTADPDSLKTQLADLDLDAMLLISPVDSATNSVQASAFSDSPMSVDLKDRISATIDDAVEDYRISLYDVGDLKQIMNDVKSDIIISTYTLGEDGEEKISSSEVFMIISLLLSTIIYFFIAMFSGMVMQSVIEEKTSRVVEVLVSSVKATELMFGKIIGVACVALTQFVLWIVLTAILVTGVTTFVGLDNMMGDPAQSEQMMQMAGQMGGVDMQQMTEVAQEDGLGVIISTLKEINYGQLIIAFFIYFALGYLLYASFFAAIGSAVENEADTQQLQMPITIPLIIGFFIAFYAFKAPDSSIVFWGSMIPFTSPIVMLARIPFGVPTWELALSIAILVGTFIACGWASAKIYQIGILMFGKKTTFKDLWKWLRMK